MMRAPSFGARTSTLSLKAVAKQRIRLIQTKINGTNTTSAIDFSLNQPDPLFRNGFE